MQGWMQIIWMVSNTYLTKTKWHTEMTFEMIPWNCEQEETRRTYNNLTSSRLQEILSFVISAVDK